MNWYKKTQLNKEADMKQLFFGLSIPIIAALLGLSIFDVEKKIQENPQEIIQQIEQKQEDIPPVSDKKVSQPENINIDLNKILIIESSGGRNNWNETTKARGPFQFLETTWNECVKRMGVNWDWWENSMDLNKSRQVTDFYYNKRIPEMLNYFNIPDTIETRIGAYDWGIGYVKNMWEKYREDWLEYSPTETQEYVIEYKGL